MFSALFVLNYILKYYHVVKLITRDFSSYFQMGGKIKYNIKLQCEKFKVDINIENILIIIY